MPLVLYHGDRIVLDYADRAFLTLQKHVKEKWQTIMRPTSSAEAQTETRPSGYFDWECLLTPLGDKETLVQDRMYSFSSPCCF